MVSQTSHTTGPTGIRSTCTASGQRCAGTNEETICGIPPASCAITPTVDGPTISGRRPAMAGDSDWASTAALPHPCGTERAVSAERSGDVGYRSVRMPNPTASPCGDMIQPRLLGIPQLKARPT